MRRLAVVGLAGVLLATAAAVPVTLAVFRSSRTAAAEIATGSILPPTSLAASVAGTTVTLTWTPTTSSGVTGYAVLRSSTSGSGYAVVGSVTPAAATTTDDAPGPGTWYYVLRSVLAGWTSTPSNEATATVAGSLTTGVVGCSANAADLGGDGDGYEVDPGNACASDGAVAVDLDSGSAKSGSCGHAGNDRHRFFGYAFGLPAAVSRIDGIGVQITARVSDASGRSIMCVELSPDGGATWTASRTVRLTDVMTTYTLGGASDAWGRAWTPAELGTGAFRVRITDVSNRDPRTFSLDMVGVEVGYTP